MKFIRQFLTDCRDHPLWSWCAGGALAVLMLPIISPEGPGAMLAGVLVIIVLGIGMVIDMLFDIFKL